MSAEFKSPPMVSVENGEIVQRFHRGQQRAMDSKARFVIVLAGSQSGKTSWAPWWLWEEICRTADEDGGKERGIPNDYLAATASYDLFKLKLLPALLEVFVHTLKAGRYWAGDQIIELRDPRDGKFWATRSSDPMWGRIVLRAATSPGGMESLTGRGGLLDECGQQTFTLQVIEAVLRRFTLATEYGMGRLLLGTTPYEWNWLKTDFYDRWERRGTPAEQPEDKDYEVIQFDSVENPAYPAKEFLRMYRTMPRWRFDMFCRGRFTRPAGQILDCFRDWDVREERIVRLDDGKTSPKRGHRTRRPGVATPWPPPSWLTIAGLDFGGAHTAAGVYVLEEDAKTQLPTGRLILTKTYQGAGGHAGDHVAHLRTMTDRIDLATGGAPSEDSWRLGYQAAGVPVLAPMEASVETGIDRMYGLIASDRFLVLETERGGDATSGGGFIDQILSYSREIDADGNVTAKIKAKSSYHKLDQFRYVAVLVAVMAGLVKSYLPTRPAIHWRASVKPEAWWVRFGSLVWREGGQSCFTLCAIDEKAKLYVLGELSSVGETGTEFATRIKAYLLNVASVPVDPMNGNRLRIRIAANSEMFSSGTRGGAYTGAGAEAFQRLGLDLTPIGAKGEGGSDTNVWTLLRRAMTEPGRLLMSRTGAPLTCLSTWLLQPDAGDPESPHENGPTLWPLSLAQALALRVAPPSYENLPEVLRPLKQLNTGERLEVR